jgi:hypothetical protein
MTSNIGWTAQSTHGYVHDEGLPGNTFTDDQLPHPEVQRAGGVNPDLWRSMHGLWVEPAVAEHTEFISTETGHAPHEVIRKTGNVESFQSLPADYPESHYVSNYVGSSANGAEYVRSATGHILHDPANDSPHPSLLPQYQAPKLKEESKDSE